MYASVHSWEFHQKLSTVATTKHIDCNKTILSRNKRVKVSVLSLKQSPKTIFKLLFEMNISYNKTHFSCQTELTWNTHTCEVLLAIANQHNKHRFNFYSHNFMISTPEFREIYEPFSKKKTEQHREKFCLIRRNFVAMQLKPMRFA